MTVKSFYFRFLSVSGRMKFCHDKTPLSRLPFRLATSCLSPCPLASLTCALAIPVLRHEWHLPCACLGVPSDICAGDLHSTPSMALRLRTSPGTLERISLDTHLRGHGDRFGVMASINSLSSTKCRIFVDEASKKDLPSTKWA